MPRVLARPTEYLDRQAPPSYISFSPSAAPPPFRWAGAFCFSGPPLSKTKEVLHGFAKQISQQRAGAADRDRYQLDVDRKCGKRGRDDRRHAGGVHGPVLP